MKAREQLLHGEEEKRMLLVSEISHDLKTPLASVQGYSEMLLSKEVDGQKQREYLQSIYDNSVRSNNILRSLFMYSKLGSSGFKPDTGRTDICEYTRQIIAGYIPVFEEKGFGFDLAIPESEIFTNTDKELFRRVYDNLIENAMRYNQAGTRIMLGIENKAGRVEIMVADNGIGIPAEHIGKIFQPFFRADRNASNSDGSGLGLAIVRQIVTLHGGEISYIGDERGCKWLISLPTTE
ncbi:MAG: HAMP domain-containing histidine kinase, partial [Oscillospiraceae bacterium]|nr:HAMP domain-containing histidine kinase [Oscillospiraceae bacterium]